MKIFNIISNIDDKKLAEIRTDKESAQTLLDQTGGKIEAMFSKGFEKGKKLVENSSAIRIERYDGQTIRIYRYLLENGDMVVITSDGQTLSLNGKLLDANHKQRFLEILASGQIKVSKKSDPVNLASFYQPKPVDMMEQERQEILRRKYESHALTVSQNPLPTFSSKRDPRLDHIAKQEKHDQKFAKKLSYLLMYGDKNA